MGFDTDGLSSAKLKLKSDAVRNAINPTGAATDSVFQTSDQPITTEKFNSDTIHDEFNISANSSITDKMAKALELRHYREGAGNDGLEISFAGSDGSNGPKQIRKEYDPVAATEATRLNSDPAVEQAINDGIEDATGRRVPPIDLKAAMANSPSQRAVSEKVQAAQSSNISFNA